MSPAASSSQDFRLVVFTLGEHRYALDLARVERVLHMVAIAPFPKAPEIVSGLIDVQGELVPVMNVRRRFHLPEHAPRPTDQLIIARTAQRRVALAVDTVENVVIKPASEIARAEQLVPGLEYVRGILRLPDTGMIFVHDLDTFLSLDEETQLTRALEKKP